MQDEGGWGYIEDDMWHKTWTWNDMCVVQNLPSNDPGKQHWDRMLEEYPTMDFDYDLMPYS